jgi:septal ring factor EnvC (AmiA/AmiB activator)
MGKCIERTLLSRVGVGVVMGFVLWGLASPPALADKDDKKAAHAQMERISRLQQAQQALESEKGQIQAEKFALEGQLKSAQVDLDKAKGAGSAAQRRESGLRRELEAARAEIQQLSDKLAQAQADRDQQVAALTARLQEAQDEAQRTQRRLASTEASLGDRSKALGTCAANNQGLYKLNSDLLARYEKRSCGGDWLVGGPFTQLGRVQVENDRDSTQDKLDSLHVTETK